MEKIKDAVGWGVATGITIGFAGLALKGMREIIPKKRNKKRKKKKY